MNQNTDAELFYSVNIYNRMFDCKIVLEVELACYQPTVGKRRN